MSEIPFGTWLPLKVGPRMEGWAVVQVKNPPRNADDLHVVRCRRKDFPEGHTHYFGNYIHDSLVEKVNE